ncbi:MAG: hypothetical protein HFJ93_02145 [Muribaculaceae bacterium]|nr:hypothetical protein [Muribaculaceae bacterium]
MTRIKSRFVAAWAAMACLGAASAAGPGLRLMTYNVHNGVGLDGRRDHDRTGNVIAAARPDFVAVQEVDSLTLRSGQTYVLGDIARQAEMIPIFAPAIPLDGGGLYGIGLLVGHLPDSTSRIPLPGCEEERMLLIADYPDYAIACTHLSLTPADALESAAIICPPDLPTFPADTPRQCIDYIMVSRPQEGGHRRLRAAEVVAEGVASDHRPVVVTLEITPPRDRHPVR